MTDNPLRAQHIQTLREMFAVCGNERRMQEADALDAAITALAAPAQDAVWLFKNGDRWHTFENDDHRYNTLADGGWEVRKFVPTPPTTSGNAALVADKLLAKIVEFGLQCRADERHGIGGASPLTKRLQEELLRALAGQAQATQPSAALAAVVACARCGDSGQEFGCNGDGPYPCRYCCTTKTTQPQAQEAGRDGEDCKEYTEAHRALIAAEHDWNVHSSNFTRGFRANDETLNESLRKPRDEAWQALQQAQKRFAAASRGVAKTQPAQQGDDDANQR